MKKRRNHLKTKELKEKSENLVKQENKK